MTVVHYNHTGYGFTRYVRAQNTPISAFSPLSAITNSHETLDKAMVEAGLVGACWRIAIPSTNGNGLTIPEHNRFVSAGFEIQDKWQDDTLIRTGMRAFVCACLGSMNEDRKMSAAGLQAYWEALLAVNQPLQHPDLSTGNSVLVVCKLLVV
jgi:hypothetical protein